MARVWQRFAAAVFCALLLSLLWSCKRPAPGGPCTSIGKYQCADAVSALLCQGGTIVSMPCRGPRGCQGQGTQNSICDDDLAQEGDPCQQTLNENYSCSTDHAKELVCKDGKFQTRRTCKGPKRCSITATTLNCDDSMADVGDNCVPESGDANFACSIDKKIEIQCDAATSKFIASNACRGPRGCWIDGTAVQCDTSFGREGDPCRPVDHRACNEDARSELKCSPQMKWVKHKDCKREGCKVKGSMTYCD
jgi:hypothetical protein